MKILHITGHLGGGVGTVICDWMDKINSNEHKIICLDYINQKTINRLWNKGISYLGNCANSVLIPLNINRYDIIIIHWWDHPMLAELIAFQFPPCRLVFWCHKHYDIPDAVKRYPDLLVGTSPIQGLPQYVWSTGNMDRFFELQPTPHEGFNVGYVGTVDWKKIHPEFLNMCDMASANITNANFIVIGEQHIDMLNIRAEHPFRSQANINFTGKVDDVAPYLQSMDVFGYPLRPDHYGTCEQAIGEAMAAGLPVVAMDNPCERTIIQEGVTGFLCKSEEEYIDNIVHLYHKPQLRKWMGQNAREAAMEKYNINNMVERWNYIFELMMNEPKKERIPIK